MGLVILSGGSPYLVSPSIRDVVINTVQSMTLTEMEDVFIHQLDGSEEEENHNG